MLKSYRTRIVSYNSHKVIRDILVTYGCILCVQCGLNFHFSEKEKTGMTLLQPEWELLLDVVFQWNQPLTYVVITLDPPIRKGQTFYPHIVLQVLFWFRHKSVYVTYVLGITLTKKIKGFMDHMVNIYTAILRNGSVYYGLHRLGKVSQFVIMGCMMKLITCHIELGLSCSRYEGCNLIFAWMRLLHLFISLSLGVLVFIFPTSKDWICLCFEC